MATPEMLDTNCEEMADRIKAEGHCDYPPLEDGVEVEAL